MYLQVKLIRIQQTPIGEDILAYYVWIPRYKYKLFNAEFKETSYFVYANPFKTCTEKCPQIIDVEFKKGIQTTGTIRCSISEIGSRTLYW